VDITQQAQAPPPHGRFTSLTPGDARAKPSDRIIGTRCRNIQPNHQIGQKRVEAIVRYTDRETPAPADDVYLVYWTCHAALRDCGPFAAAYARAVFCGHDASRVFLP